VIIERDRLQKKYAVEDKREHFKAQRVTAVKTVSVNRGAFACLDDSDDEEAPVTMKRSFSLANEKKEEWPALCTVASKPINDKPSFASIAANPLPIKKVDTSRPNICGFTVITKDGAEYIPTVTTKPVVKNTGIRSNWADDYDTDSDVEDDYTAWN